MGFKIVGNKLPEYQRWKPEAYWWRLTVAKNPPPHMQPARGKVKKIYLATK